MKITDERLGKVAIAVLRDHIRREIRSSKPFTPEKAIGMVHEILLSRPELEEIGVTTEEVLSLFYSVMPDDNCKKIFNSAVIGLISLDIS